MAKLTKKRKEALSKYNQEELYSLEDASSLIKEINTASFDASVDINVRLGVDPRKADQMVRGVVTLPHGTGKTVREYLYFVLLIKRQKPKKLELTMLGWMNTSRRLKVDGQT